MSAAACFNADEFALALRHTDKERQLQFSPGGEDRLQCPEVGDIKVAHGHMALIRIGRELHGGFSYNDGSTINWILVDFKNNA